MCRKDSNIIIRVITISDLYRWIKNTIIEAKIEAKYSGEHSMKQEVSIEWEY